MAYIFGTKSQSVLNEILFETTTTWACNFTCRAIVTVIGAGGGGGAARHDNAGGAVASAGGGAGGVAKSLLTLTSGTSYVATIGGAGSYNGTSGNGEATGGTGGDSSWKVSGGSALLTGNGGTGGPGSGSGGSGGNTPSVTGGAGGAASGGNIFNATGGEGGDAQIANYDGNGFHIAAGGGGAPGIFGKGHRGGDAACTTGGYNKVSCAGGAGVWGEGGDATTTNGNGIEVAGVGGSIWGKGHSFSEAADKNPFLLTLPNMYNYNFRFRGFYPIGQHTSYLTDAAHTMQGQTKSIFDGLTGSGGRRTIQGNYAYSGPGAGGTGAFGSGAYSNAHNLPGLFGGGGADAVFVGSGSSYGGAGSLGAGGGGVAVYSNSNPYSGKGGGGLVVVSILEYL